MNLFANSNVFLTKMFMILQIHIGNMIDEQNGNDDDEDQNIF